MCLQWLLQLVNLGLQEMESLTNFRKEISLVLAAIVALLGLVGIVYLVSPGIGDEKHWAQREWVSFPCSVAEVGVAYRGTCDLRADVNMVKVFHHFSECMGKQKHRQESKDTVARWYRTSPGRCAERGDLDFEHKAYSALERRRLQEGGDNALARELRHIGFGHPVSCHNRFLAWAEVRLINGSVTAESERRCAYKYGAVHPSLTDDWALSSAMYDNLKSRQHADEIFHCWQLQRDDCVVAFDDVDELKATVKARDYMIEVTSAVCGFMLLGFLGLAGWFHAIDEGWCTRIYGRRKRDYDALPTSDDRGIEMESDFAGTKMSDRAQNLLSIVASTFNMETPPPSGPPTDREDSSKTMNMIRVSSANGVDSMVPRNIAADFIK